MTSAKKASLKFCRKCNCLLTINNWKIYDKKNSNYLCMLCKKQKYKKFYKNNLEYIKKQRNKYRMRRSAVIFYYGNQCNKCSEDEYNKLVISNIEYLYNTLVNKDGYQVLCYNCHYTNKTKHIDKYMLRDKYLVLSNYGQFCNICNEDKIECLTLTQDQVKYTGTKMYRWLINNNFPVNIGLKILCYNCKYSIIATAKYEPEIPG